MKKKPFTYVIDCGDFDSFSSVFFAMREAVNHNAAILKIMKNSNKIWSKKKFVNKLTNVGRFLKFIKVFVNIGTKQIH